MNIKGHFETITRHKAAGDEHALPAGSMSKALPTSSKYSPTEFIPGCNRIRVTTAPNGSNVWRGVISSAVAAPQGAETPSGILDRLQHPQLPA